ncbi:MAG TPA: DUF4105 domain-containing protein [Oligoflexia bacterium]|nr:DUF4105 domain-containing protein [Oligoflexia bacterium]HMP48595.1 DUF4105 domain-containing protein [Oligoflexia bacterium]
MSVFKKISFKFHIFSLLIWLRFHKNIFFLIVLPAICPFSSFADSSDSIIPADIIDQSRVLSNDSRWLTLLQVWENVFFNKESRVDDSSWFLSKEGKLDPEAEIVSTLHALIKEQDNPDDDNPQCLHRGRFKFLDRELGLVSKGLLKEAPCFRYSEWRNNLGVKNVTLVFPAAYLNNPASMFGHTLFRLDSETGITNPLLSYAANFGAATGDDGGVAFALKGLLGGYQAGFSVEPYYETVNRYGDIEHRDIWEYEILLGEEERERFLELLWELRQTYFNYFFFDENCSLYVLALLDYARPGLNLVNDLSWWVIPSDTVKILLSRENLLGSPKYRPSLLTRVETAGNNLSGHELKIATQIASGEYPVDVIEIYGEESSAKILEFSFDYLEFLSSRESDVSPDNRARAKEVLVKRSVLPPLKHVPVPSPDTRPELMHESGRVILRGGVRDNLLFSDILFRPAYHESLDPEKGFREGAAIDFFSGGIRYLEGNGVMIRNFYPVSIESYTPWGKVFKPFSWDVRTGFEREMLSSEKLEGSGVGFIEASRGISIKPSEFLKLSSLISARSNISRAYNNESYAIGIGPKIRSLILPDENFRIQISGSAYFYELGERHVAYYTNVEAQYDIQVRDYDQFFLRAGFGYEKSFGEGIREVFIGFGSYF